MTENIPEKKIRRHPRLIEIPILLFLICIPLVVYQQVRGYDFISFDDPNYVTENDYVPSGLTKSGIKRAFQFSQKTDQYYFHPITMLSHMLDCELFGLNAGQHHFTNVVLHILNTILLFFLLRWITGRIWCSAFVAALFALHPINVDTVAWIAERKNLVSTLFGLLMILSYIWFTQKRNILIYLLCMLFLLTGLLSKPMLVTFPFLLLLLDFWPLKRLYFHRSLGLFFKKNKNLLYEKVPLFALSFLWVYISLLSNARMGILVETKHIPMSLRIENALVSYVMYIWKMLWPFDLSVFYPYPTHMFPLWQIAGVVVLLSFYSFVAIRNFKRFPWLLFGWLWYLGTLVPVLGLTQNGLWPAMADRWTYIPLIGIFIILTWSGAIIYERFPQKITAGFFAGVFILAISVNAWQQLQYWKSSKILFKHAMDATENNWLAHNKYGFALQEQGADLDECIRHFTEAIRLNPSYAKAYNNLGCALEKKKNFLDSIASFKRAIRQKPDFTEAHINLGSVFIKQGKAEEGITFIRKALAIEPDNPQALYSLGVAYDQLGQPDSSISYYKKAIQKRPAYAKAHNNLGTILIASKQFKKAVFHFKKALEADPGFMDAKKNLAAVLSYQKNIGAAIAEVKKKQAADPENPALYFQMGELSSRIGKQAEAIASYRKALSFQPDYIPALNGLALQLAEKKDYSQAVSLFTKITELRPDLSKVYYNVACIYAIQEKASEAVNWLRLAIKNGYTNWKRITNDKDLARIRASDLYKQIIRPLAPHEKTEF